MTTQALRLKKVTAGLLVCLVFGMPFAPLAASAATTTYDASIIALDAPSRLAPGQTYTVNVTIQNIGSATWSNKGANFVSIYGYDFNKHTEVNSPLSS
ncbi:MAG TPA: hypothetical protein VMU11_03310, partial [Verrucomicrobiae bacterium]|nr:hypothetical protein [Verrucomicrobiae bacterium]